MARHGLIAQVVPFPVGAPACQEARPGVDTWRLLYAGRMELIKGGSVLIEAIPRVLESAQRPLHVIMAGDGRDRPRWEARAREIEKAMPNVQFEFTGWLAHDDVQMLIKNVDLLVVPSLWPEPFGSVGPAAARYGVPAAGFAVGGIPQWLLEGVTGHLAPGNPPTPAGLSRAILQCLEDPLHYAALREGARQMASTFTMERHLPELMKVLARA